MPARSVDRGSRASQPWLVRGGITGVGNPAGQNGECLGAERCAGSVGSRDRAQGPDAAVSRHLERRARGPPVRSRYRARLACRRSGCGAGPGRRSPAGCAGCPRDSCPARAEDLPVPGVGPRNPICVNITAKNAATANGHHELPTSTEAAHPVASSPMVSGIFQAPGCRSSSPPPGSAGTVLRTRCRTAAQAKGGQLDLPGYRGCCVRGPHRCAPGRHIATELVMCRQGPERLPPGPAGMSEVRRWPQADDSLGSTP